MVIWKICLIFELLNFWFFGMRVNLDRCPFQDFKEQLHFVFGSLGGVGILGPKLVRTQRGSIPPKDIIFILITYL
jgi:hypothetical protein